MYNYQKRKFCGELDNMKVAKTFWTILIAIINYSLFSCFIIGWSDLAFSLDIMFGTYMAAFFFFFGLLSCTMLGVLDLVY